MVKERNLTRWIFVLPAMIIVGLLFVYPFFSSIFYSFTNKHLIMPNYKFVGLANYKAVLSDPNFFNPNHSYLSQLDVTYKTPDLMSHFLPPHEVSFTFCCSSIVFPR